MKHGDKAKAKTAKSSRKTSDEKSSKASGKGSKAAPPKVAAAKRGGETKTHPGKAVPEKSRPAAKAGAGGRPAAGATTGAAAPADPGFGNPAVASAFKRAVKKYPNAFRRLTD